MSIDAKMIEEFRRLIQPWTGDVLSFAAGAREAIDALLSEREEMQRDILSLRARVEAQAVLGAPVQFVPVDADPEWRVEALAVLRSVEWANERMTTEYPRRLISECPECGGVKPENENDVHGTGHFDDCRLAALLRGQP